jgi:hypothetical protein
VALGFECPLFLPLPLEETDLGKAREGEGNRAWSAGAGACALATGLVQVAWVLDRLRTLVTVDCTTCLNWSEFLLARPGLLIWEAFVSGGGGGADDVDDAKCAVEAFRAASAHAADKGETLTSAIRVTGPVYSLAGAAILRAGWSCDQSPLHQACIVIRPQQP